MSVFTSASLIAFKSGIFGFHASNIDGPQAFCTTYL